VARTNDSYHAAKYRRIASRRGPSKAAIAIERTMLVSVITPLGKQLGALTRGDTLELDHLFRVRAIVPAAGQIN
jgi:hypothetical protein